jgi:hypothetical protein
MNTAFQEYMYADHLQHSAPALVDPEGLIENGDHQVCVDSDPDLGLHSVFAQPIEGFEAKVLLDPLEEEFDLTAGFVDFRDHNGVDLEVVGYENQAFSGFCIQKAYSAQIVPVEAFCFRSVETDRLIGSQSGGLLYWARFAKVVPHVYLPPSDEERRSHMNPIEQSEIDVSAIHCIKGSSFEDYPIQGVDLVDLSLGDRHECRDGSVQVDHGVGLDGGFSPSKPSPRKEAHAQVYRGRVDSVDDFVHLRDVSISSVQLASFSNEDLSELEIDMPVQRFVGVREIGSRHQPSYTLSVKQIGLGSKTCLDIAQALPESKLGEGHAEELVPCGKTLAFSGHGIVGYTTLELLPADNVANLGEYYTAFVHNENETQIRSVSNSNSDA